LCFGSRTVIRSVNRNLLDQFRRPGGKNQYPVREKDRLFHVVGDHLYYYQAIHQEADVVPENIDCIRAMFKLTLDNMESIRKTNAALGI